MLRARYTTKPKALLMDWKVHYFVPSLFLTVWVMSLTSFSGKQKSFVVAMSQKSRHKSLEPVLYRHGLVFLVWRSWRVHLHRNVFL
jgi:hypothetical protein